jgi:uncharacterized damage-inducible protein DinB
MLKRTHSGQSTRKLRTSDPPVFDLAQSLLESYAVNERMNQFVLDHLDPRAWRAKVAAGRGRTIAAIFSHMHNVRRKWLRLSTPHLPLPGPLQHARCTQPQAQAALAESAARCCEMLAAALSGPESHTATFQRDGLAKPWPAGAAMVAYMITHDAHHRGQVCMLAHQLGFPIKNSWRIWAWEQLWKDCGFTHPR